MNDPAALMLYGDTVRRPELRHEVPLTIVDPFLFIEAGDRRVVVIGDLEVARVEKLDGFEVVSTESFGYSKLRGEASLEVLAVEPALYIGGFGGRLEDAVLVTDEGCERLTQVTYELC